MRLLLKKKSKPINGIDQAAYYRDCDFYKAENSGINCDKNLK